MIGIVTGLTAEARLAARLGTTRAGGGTPEGARQAAEDLIAHGATALVSFGLAGGLNPTLRPGALIIPAAVGAVATDPVLTRALGGPIGTLHPGTQIATTAAEKARLNAITLADAIDLESGEVSAVSVAHGVKVAVLRAICDPADSTLPPAAIIALDARGTIALARVAASVLRHPGQLPALLRLAGHAAAARAALQQRVRDIGQIRSE